MEQWTYIQGLEGLYQINKLGYIRNSKLFIIRYGINKHGYKNFCLYKNGVKKHYSLHRLLAIAFIPNPENKKCVNHIDGNKLNNDINNLEWCTSSENNIHALQNNLRIHPKGEKVTQSKLTNEAVVYIRNTKGVYTNQQMADKYMVSRSVIAQVRLYKAWKHID